MLRKNYGDLNVASIAGKEGNTKASPTGIEGGGDCRSTNNWERDGLDKIAVNG